MTKEIKISPSILSADFGKLNQEIRDIEQYADSLHIDVMDGNFVHNLTFGDPVVRDIRTSLPLDVHLMIMDPVGYAPDFADYSRRIFFHAELFKNKKKLKKAIEDIRNLGVKVGLTINPDKKLKIITPFLDEIDAVLIMSVYAGFAGQDFLPEQLEKVKELRNKFKFEKDILIDGGINKETARQAVEAGANVLVAGTAIFKAEDKAKAVEELRRAVE